MIKLKYIAFLVLCFSLFTSLFAQQEEIEKEVLVEKAYEPEVADAQKISELPQLVDTIQVEPEYTYQVFPVAISTEYRAEPIQPATMVGESLSRLYNKFIMVGAGNKVLPSVQLGINNLRNDEFSIGGLASIASSSARVKHLNDEKIFAGYGDSDFKVYGKKFFNDAIFSSALDLKTTRRYFYGYAPSVDTSFNRSDIKQRYTDIGFDSRFKSNYQDSLHLNYNIHFDYYYFQDMNNHQENRLDLQGNFDKFIGTERFGVDGGFTFFERSASLDSFANFLVNGAAWIGKFETDWQVKAGIKIVSDFYNEETTVYYYPVASFEYNIVNNYVVPYIGVDGGLNENPYQQTAYKNPFIIPGVTPRKSNNKIEIYGGIRGTASPSTSYNLRVRYRAVDDMHFFINDGSLTGNQFNVVYDDIQVTELFGEFQAGIGDKLNFHVQGNLFNYAMQDEEKPWHKPNYRLSLSGRYNIQDKIILKTAVFGIGERHAFLSKDPVSGDVTYNTLDAVIDLNAEIEYFFSKVFSAYLKFNNITGSQYQVWNYYPTYGFNIQAGIYYAF